MNKRFFLFGWLLYGCTIVAQTSISRAEYWIDNDPGCGEATALPITNNGVSSAIPTSSLSEGWHTLGLRAKGGNDNWSNTCTQLFFVPNAASSLIGQLTGLEYFIDSDPGHGQATAIPFTPGQTEFALALQETDTLPPGLHSLGIRARYGYQWSTTTTHRFLTVPPEQDGERITAVEYWLDTDPGYGQATAIPFTPGQKEFALALQEMDTLPPGLHSLGIRARYGYQWSTTTTHRFLTVPPEQDGERITAVEYWLDTDPGYGQATAIPFTPGQTEFALALQEMDTLPPGLHMIGLRARRGPVWTETYTRTFLNAALHPQMEVTAVEAYWDNDTTTTIPLPFTREEGYYLVSGALINTGDLALGSHILCIRATADGRQSVMQCFEVIISKDDPTGLTNTTNALHGAYKILRGNRVYIICPLNEKDSKIYTVTGTEVQ